MSPRTAHRPSRAHRRFAAAVLAIVGIAGFGIASAAQLNLTGSTISAGSTLVASCQPSGTINVGFAATWVTNPTPAAYRVSTVTLTNVNANCNGKPFRLQFLNIGGTAAIGAEVTGASLALVGTTATITIGGTPPLASDVGGVALVIQG